MKLRNCFSSLNTTGMLASSILLGLVSAGHAASLTGTVAAVEDGTAYDLTALGTADWAYWSTADNPAGGVPTNEKSGSDMLAALYPVEGSAVRGTASGSTEADFTFSDGTTVESGTVEGPLGLFNTKLRETGYGVGVYVTLPTTGEYTVYVWGAAYRAQIGTLTVAMTGAEDVSLNAFEGVETTNPKETWLFTINAQADVPGALLSLELVLTESLGASANIAITAVAVAGTGGDVETTFASLINAGLDDVQTFGYSSDVYGYFWENPNWNSWIYHEGLGWLYTGSVVDSDSLWFWSNSLETWIYTYADSFGWCYVLANADSSVDWVKTGDSAWVYYAFGVGGRGWLYVPSDEAWVTVMP